MAQSENLKYLQIRYYDPEKFPTKDLLTYGSDDVFNVTEIGMENITQVQIWAQDYIYNYSVNAVTPIWQGGGTNNLADNPPFPSCIRLTAAVHREGNEFSGVNPTYLGETTIPVTIPTNSGWIQYSDCIESGNDDCGDILSFDTWVMDPSSGGFNSGGGSGGGNPGSGGGNIWTGTTSVGGGGTLEEGNVTTQDETVFLSVCHKDLFISGWGGNIGDLGSSSSRNKNILGYGGFSLTNQDGDYELNENDLEMDNDAGFYCLKILEGTQFGKDGAYPAEFKVGERVRIFGATPDFMNDLAPEQTNGDMASPNRLFRGNQYWFSGTSYGINGSDCGHDYVLGDTNGVDLPEDIDGVGFESPFFYHLQYSFMNYVNADESDHATAINVRQSGDWENLMPQLNPLQPETIPQRSNNITNHIDSRIKYIIFQNTLGMMNDATDIPLPDEFGGANVIQDTTASSFAYGPSFDTYDYGIVPVAGQNEVFGSLHNKVHIYIVFRDEFVGTPIIYGPNDSRNMINIDFDGIARIVGSDNELIFEGGGTSPSEGGAP